MAHFSVSSYKQTNFIIHFKGHRKSCAFFIKSILLNEIVVFIYRAHCCTGSCVYYIFTDALSMTLCPYDVIPSTPTLNLLYIV